MLRTRIIPCLLLKDKGLVKTLKFNNPTYIGDPINAVKIFNDKEVDELIFLDISVTPLSKSLDFVLIEKIATETFMPFGYGGGIRSMKDIEKLFKIGVEKVILNTSAYNNPTLVTEAVKVFGSQSILISIDYKVNLFGNTDVYIQCGARKIKESIEHYSKRMEELGAGEIFLNSIDQDGTQNGYDLKIIKKVTSILNIPLIACGGAGTLKDFRDAVILGGASGVAAGSVFVFQGKHRAVLITYPLYSDLEKLFK